MTMKQQIVLSSFLAATALFLLPVTGFGRGPQNACEGAWINSFKGGSPPSPPLLGVITLSPIDPSGYQLNWHGTPVNPFLSLGGGALFPDTASVSPGVGVATWRSTNTYDLKWIDYAVKAPVGWFRGEIQYIMLIESTIECKEDTVTETGVFTVYSAINATFHTPTGPVEVQDQDTDKDGFPDEDEKPILSFPFQFNYKRLK